MQVDAIPATHERTQPVQNAIELLKSQREHVDESTRVLEAIIAHCSDIAHIAPFSPARAVARRLVNRALALYATPESITNKTIQNFLDETIVKLEQEPGSAT